ncbi:DNA cytosine methyltransferase [Streptomyces beihaiensis]|uniref:DNA (cytosine-5-)-methyltransferase n=1 Tax=Streptomyces beihaiensis TaxID=2984495 RepID=A0ABT3U3K8_9ACTN|nr:DNA cytosine methyltransferase [Streptomyces beihaiensis]MCX3063630.1 DNA cytosine methyltransferase [Streptomyces beihaiensis]
MPEPRNIKILDLFAGPGGLDVAAHFLGIPSMGIEWDRNACLTRYRAGLDTIHGNVSKVRTEQFAKIPEDYNVLAGGPPCQSFSVAGKGRGRDQIEDLKKLMKLMEDLVDDHESPEIDKELEKLDPRAALVLEPLRWLLKRNAVHGKPYDAIILEQVPTALPVWHEYKEILRSLPGDLAYECPEPHVLRTERYGVPQTRQRAIFVARRKNADFAGELKLPKGTFRSFDPRAPYERAAGAPIQEQTLFDPHTDSGPLPWRSMHKALKAAGPFLTYPEGTSALPENFVVVSNYGSGGDPKKRGRRSSHFPAFTVTGKVSRNVVLVDDEDHRRFTIPEAGAFQTFPGNYPWAGNDQSQQVGNAVPPVFAMHVLSAALGIPLPEDPVGAALKWEPASEERAAELRERGCGNARACTEHCPSQEEVNEK